MVVLLLQSLLVHRPPVTTLLLVDSYDTVAAVAVCYDSDNTATVSSKVAPSADATAAGTTIVSDDSDNTVSFGSDDARTAGSRGFLDPAAAITTDTPIITDDSDNAISAGGDTAIAAGSQGFSYPADVITTSGTPIPTDDSDNAISASGDTAIAAGSRGFSDPAAVITTSTPILADDSDNAISVGGNIATVPVAVITTSTSIPTDDSDNAISAGGGSAIAAGSRWFSDPAPSITADAPNLSIDNDNTPVRRDSAAVSITTDTPSVADAANISIDGVSVAVVAITSDSSDHSTDGCCSDTFICTLCSAAVRMLFDQFKVEQSNSLISIVTGRCSRLERREAKKRWLEGFYWGNTRKIKALEDRLSKRSVLPLWIVRPECSATPQQAVPLMHRS